MYGTTIRSYTENKDSKYKKNTKDKAFYNLNENKKNAKKINKKDQDTKYMKINTNSKSMYNVNDQEQKQVNEGFSIKDLPIASVVITVILTMMMLVMTSGFGGL